MFNIYSSIAAILLAIGVLVGLVFALLSKKKFLGGMWAAILVGVFGAFLGSVFWYVLEPVLSRLTDVMGVINVYPPIISAIIFVYVYKALSHKE